MSFGQGGAAAHKHMRNQPCRPDRTRQVASQGGAATRKKGKLVIELGAAVSISFTLKWQWALKSRTTLNRESGRLSWIINDRGTIMAWLKFIGLFTISHGGNRNQQGGVPFNVACLAALLCGWTEFWRTEWLLPPINRWQYRTLPLERPCQISAHPHFLAKSPV